MRNAISVIHIDDDAGFLNYFQNLLSETIGINYRHGFTDVKAASAYLQREKPDIIFLDVEMPGENGLWLAERIDISTADIVFVSSHSTYAVKAFEACAMDYLVKPVTHDKFQKFLNRYLQKKQRTNPFLKEQLKEVYTTLKEQELPSRIFINTVGKIIIAELKEISHFTARDNYTEIFMQDGTKYTSGKSIRTYEQAVIKDKNFIRVHRSYIINKMHAKYVICDSRKKKIAAVMVNGETLEMSYLKKDEIMELLK